MWVFVSILTILISYITIKIIHSLHYWKNRNIPHLKPWPVVGNFGSVVFRKKNFAYLIEDYYKSFPNKRYFGIHQLSIPSLVVTDLDLIKRITVKDFDHFVDHTTMISTELEPLFQKTLFLLTGQEWKNMRGTLSPSFTGKKIRIMFTLMKDCAKQFNEFFLRQNEDIVELEIKDVMTRYTNDVIVSCVLGMKCNSINDKENDFYKMAKSVLSNSLTVWVKSMMQVTIPWLAKKLKLSILPSEATDFFENTILDTMRARKEKNIVRPDMIYLLMEAMKREDFEDNSKDVDMGFAAVDDSFLKEKMSNDKIEKGSISTDDVIAQALLFFLAGFETVAVLLSHCLNELAVNPDIQKKLQDEIDKELEKSDEKDLNYEAVVGMKYLDMDYIINADGKFDEKPLLVNKGLSILIPVYGIHRDPKYYPDPEKFDPERFSEENRDKLVPYSFIPFGVGPRNCIGSRFALLEAKTVISSILSKFDVVPTAKTEIPLKLASDKSSPIPNEFWLGLKKRTNR